MSSQIFGWLYQKTTKVRRMQGVTTHTLKKAYFGSANLEKQQRIGLNQLLFVCLNSCFPFSAKNVSRSPSWCGCIKNFSPKGK